MGMLMHLFLNHFYQLGNRSDRVCIFYEEFQIYSVYKDRQIFLLGIVQGLFEASMYVFVLEWTPALTEALNKTFVDKTDNKNPPIPHGLNKECFFF
jgi:hypothetical protein